MDSYVLCISGFGGVGGWRASVRCAAVLRSGNAPAPTAASSAAPYAPPSSRLTVVTGRPNTSACNCLMNAFFAPPLYHTRVGPGQPGAARSLGSTRGCAVGARAVPDVDQLDAASPGVITPAPARPQALSAPPPTTGVPAGSPVSAAGGGVTWSG